MRRGKARDTGPTPAVRQKVRERAQWRCEKCGRNAVSGGEVHHRRPRRMGGTLDPAVNLPSNLVLLCHYCHRDIESNRMIAIGTGWLVSSQLDPAKIPIRTREFGYIFLTEDGSYSMEAPNERDKGRPGDGGPDSDGPAGAAPGA